MAGQNDTNGGSSESEVTDWQANPSGRSPSWAVMTVTPVQKLPRALRSAVETVLEDESYRKAATAAAETVADVTDPVAVCHQVLDGARAG